MNLELRATSPRRLLFGPFAFDHELGELRKHGIRLKLQGQPLLILAALVRQPGQVITRDEFRHQLWTDSTFVDFDHGLNAAMNRLRQTLGDSPDHPRYIETLPGRGYRFIAAVQDSMPEPVLPVAPMPRRPGSKKSLQYFRLVAAARKLVHVSILVAGVIAGSLGGISGRRPATLEGKRSTGPVHRPATGRICD